MDLKSIFTLVNGDYKKKGFSAKPEPLKNQGLSCWFLRLRGIFEEINHFLGTNATLGACNSDLGEVEEGEEAITFQESLGVLQVQESFGSFFWALRWALLSIACELLRSLSRFAHEMLGSSLSRKHLEPC